MLGVLYCLIENEAKPVLCSLCWVFAVGALVAGFPGPVGLRWGDDGGDDGGAGALWEKGCGDCGGGFWDFDGLGDGGCW